MVLSRTKWLPGDSAFRASLSGGTEHIGWSIQAWQGKHIFDAIQSQSALMYRLQMGKKAKRFKPATFPTPMELLAKARKTAQKAKKDNGPAQKPTLSIDQLGKLLG